MNIVLIIPTGIGAEIGGHAGDANPVAKLFGGLCDNLILHPNVVNASDINEMPENAWYVEGSILDRFLRGEINLKRPHYNKILIAVNSPVKNETINAVSAARVTIGAVIEILVLETQLTMNAYLDEGKATGEVTGWQELVKQVSGHDFDALAINTKVEVDEQVALNYLKNGGVNPWGGVEAKASKLITSALNKPAAHAPCGSTLEKYNEVVDPRMAAEMVSVCYLHSVLKGLHRAPRISKSGLGVEDLDFLISPFGCFGAPHKACHENGVPIIVVRENKTICNDEIPESENIIHVENYLEAAGVVSSQKAGIYYKCVRRPMHSSLWFQRFPFQRQDVYDWQFDK